MTGIIRVALYARVSSQQQADANTIDSQKHAILERIRCDGLRVDPDCMFCDDGYSGSELLRPALESLRDRVAASMIDLIYIHTPDRLARKYAHQALLLEEFSKHHCKVIFGDHRGLADNPETNLLVQMQGVIAEYEREKIMERTRRGRRHAAVSGNVSVFGRAPYGYLHIKKTTSGGKAIWEIDPVRSKHVQLMFKLVGDVWQDVCKLLQDPKRLRTELERRRNLNVNNESNLNELVRRVGQVRSRIDRLIDAYESGLLEKAEFESRIVTLRSEHDRESFALSSLRGTLNESDDTATAESVLEQLRIQIGKGLETASEELKRDVIKLLVRRIEIHREEIRLVYKVPQNPFDRRPETRGFLPHCLEREPLAGGLPARHTTGPMESNAIRS